MTSTDEILFEVKEGGIAWLTFNRPEARNAMTFGMYEGIADVCRRIESDGSVRVLILRGAGDKAFVSGTDISQFRDFKTAEQALAYESRMDRVFDAIEEVRPRRSSAFPSRARSGTRSRCATTRGSQRSSASRAPRT